MHDDIWENIILQDMISPSGRFKIVSPHTLYDVLDDSTPIENDDGTFTIVPYMSDTPEERAASLAFVTVAKGKVLQFGLGIGLTVKALEKKEDVQHIVVIEKNQEIIDMISEQLQFSDKVEIIKGDLFYYLNKYPAQPTFNAIFIDISTPGFEMAEYADQGVLFSREEMAQKLQQYLLPGGWIDYFKPVEVEQASDNGIK